jgi:hypothetical protein
MKDYLLLYRAEVNGPKRSPEEMDGNMKLWMDWMGGIAAQNKLTDQGNRLTKIGKVLRKGNIIADGPYTEIKEAIGGYSIVKATSIEDATVLAHGCPILSIGGNVEIREIGAM